MARATIAAAPDTHLGRAAREVLLLLDSCDTARVEAAEAHLSVLGDALTVAREEAAQLDNEVAAQKSRADFNFHSYQQQATLAAKMIAERDRLARELEAAKVPDPDLMRLRALEHAAEQIRAAIPPIRAEGRAAWTKMLALLTPHLT